MTTSVRISKTSTAAGLRQNRRIRRVGTVLAATNILIGAIVLAGWLWQVPLLKRLAIGFVAMVPSTALCFLLAGVALLLLDRAVTPARRATGDALAIVIIAIPTVNLLLQARGVGSGIDAWLLGPSVLPAADYMSPSTSVCFVLAGGCLALMRKDSARRRRSCPFVAAIGLVVALVALAGYAFDVSALYAVAPFSAMALHTSIGFIVLFLALLMLRPTWGWMRTIIGQLDGSVAIRRLLPATVLVPFVLSWLTLKAVDADLFSANFRLALNAVLTIGMLAGLLVLTGSYQNRVDRHRRKTLRDLETTLTALERSLAERDTLLQEVYHRVKNNLQMVEALIFLQMKDVTDENARRILDTTRYQIHALGRVHQQLLQSGDLANIALHRFLPDLVDDLALGLGARERGIVAETQCEEIEFDIERALSLGLIVNELVTNAFKHAYSARGGGRLAVSARRDNGAVVLTIADEGTGAADAQRLAAVGSTGMGQKILDALVAQIDGKIEASDEGGRMVRLRMPDPGAQRSTAT